MKLVKEHWLIIALILLNLIFKGLYIGLNPLGGDEPYSVYHAQCDLASIIRYNAVTNNPPLYELFLHFWIMIFGISEIAVRVPSLIFNTVTLFFILRIGNEFFNKKTAATAGIIFIFSNYQIFFAHEARVYPLIGMLTAISMFLFMRILIRRKSSSDLILMTICNVLLIYSHYFGFFVIVVQWLIILLKKEYRSKYFLLFSYSLVATMLIYIPNLMVMLNRFLSSSSHGTWVTPTNELTSIYNMLWKFSNVPVVTVSVIVLFASVITLFFIKKKSLSPQAMIILVWFAFPFFFMFLISFKIPMFLDRYLMFVSVAFVLLVGASATYLMEHKIFSYLIPSVFCILFIVTSRPELSNYRDSRGAMEKVKELKKDNTLVIFCPHYFSYNFSYYYDREIFIKSSNVDDYIRIDSGLRVKNVFGIDKIDAVDLANREHVIYLDAGADFCSPGNNVLEGIKTAYTLKAVYDYPEIFRVYEFTRTD